MKYFAWFLLVSLGLASCNTNTETPANTAENTSTATAGNTTDTGEPWRSDQLMAPADLAAMINNNDPNLPLIVSIGPSGQIKGSVDIGPAQDEETFTAFKKYLEGVKKDQPVVIYCGCCPFSPCPNVRPAFTLLNELGFTNHKLLNLSTNLKTDWINPGYPMIE